MKISAQFMPGDLPVFVDSVRKAEESGYARAYLVDGQLLWRNVFVYMTLGLDATERIPFGTAVTNPYTRHPSVLANAHATLEEIYPGRVMLGIGRGDNSVRTLGKKQVATDRMRDIVPMLRDLMAGKDDGRRRPGSADALGERVRCADPDGGKRASEPPSRPVRSRTS